MILVRYVLKELIGPFLASLFGITFLFVVDFLVKILDNVLSKGLPTSTVLEIFALNLAWMLSLSIPMAVLVASLMTFGRMSGDQEITAVKAAGVSPLSLMRPVLLVALLLSVLMVVFNNWVLPEANHRSVELMNAVSRKKPHVFIDAGRLITQFPGVQLWVNRIDPVSGTLYGIQIFEMEKKGAPRIVYADSASMDYVDNGATLMLRLRSGETHLVDPDDADKYFRIRFFSQDLAMQNVDDRLERRSRSYRSDREMPVEMMWDVVKDAREKYDTAAVQAKTRRLPTLLRIRDFVSGDSIVPVDAKSVPMLDSVQFMQGLRKVRIQETSSLRATERAWNRMDGELKREAQYMVEIHKKFSTAFARAVSARVSSTALRSLSFTGFASSVAKTLLTVLWFLLNLPCGFPISSLVCLVFSSRGRWFVTASRAILRFCASLGSLAAIRALPSVSGRLVGCSVNSRRGSDEIF